MTVNRGEGPRQIPLRAAVAADSDEKGDLAVATEEPDAFLYRFFVVRHLRPTALPPTSRSAQTKNRLREGRANGRSAMMTTDRTVTDRPAREALRFFSAL